MFLLGLQFGGTIRPWDSTMVICLIIFGVASIIFFVIVECMFALYPLEDNFLNEIKSRDTDNRTKISLRISYRSIRSPLTVKYQ
jgi:hypothetical protein